MNQKNSQEPSESSKSCSDKNICERHWIFKRNKDFIQRKYLQRSTKDCNPSLNSYKDDHKRFQEHLSQLQQSLPSVNTKKFVIVDQVMPDSPAVKNLCVNHASCRKGNINLKIIGGTGTKIKEVNSITDQNDNSISRSRLFRKCKINKIVEEGSDGSDDDFIIEKSSCLKQEETNKKRKISTLKDTNHEENGDVVTTVEKLPKANTLKVPDKSSEILDELLGNVDLDTIKKKKRKIDSQGSNVMNNIQNATKHFISKYPLLNRLTNKITINGHNQDKDNKVIEIEDVGNTEKDANTGGVKKIKHSCPMCNKMFYAEEINNHAYSCQGPTRTRNQKMKKDSQENTGVSFDETAWESACKGLNKNFGEVSPKKEESPEEIVDLKSDRNILVDNGTRTTNSHDSKSTNQTTNQNPTNRNLTNRNPITMMDVKDPLVPNKFKCNPKMEEKLNEGNQYNVGCKQYRQVPNRPMSKDFICLDDSTRDIIGDYMKTSSRITKKPSAKHLRSFGEKNTEEHDIIKCARCDQFFSDDQIQMHTNSCLEKSISLG